MPRGATWTILAVPVVVLGLVALVVAFADRRVEVPTTDLRYFHTRPDNSGKVVESDNSGKVADLSYVSMQVKSVAASRRIPLQDIRRLLDESTVERAGVAIGRRHVDIPRLNLALDERWPLK